ETTQGTATARRTEAAAERATDQWNESTGSGIADVRADGPFSIESIASLGALGSVGAYLAHRYATRNEDE
ncbi:hypothetical protein ACFQE1_18575, partial [Halobium palmae]